MKVISTRLAETECEKALVYALRYEYYVATRELEFGAADHDCRWLRDTNDNTALQFGTFAGEELVGCFRAEIGAPERLSFGADWQFSDFIAELPREVAIVSGLCTANFLRDGRVLSHMVRESVSIAKDFGVKHIFFELCPDLWPLYHAAGLVRTGGALPHRQSGLLTAVFHLDLTERVAVPRPPAAVITDPAGGDLEMHDLAVEIAPRRRFALVVGGR